MPAASSTVLAMTLSIATDEPSTPVEVVEVAEVDNPEGSLPRTGSTTGPIVMLGAALVIAGGGLVAGTRYLRLRRN